MNMRRSVRVLCVVILALVVPLSLAGAASSLDAGWWTPGTQSGAEFGRRLWSMGDVNCDGFEDFLAPVPLYDHPSYTDAGIVYLYYGSLTGPDTRVTINPPSLQLYGFWGANAGHLDANGDGCDDIAITYGNYESNGAVSDEGGVFVWYGSPSGINPTHDFLARGNSLYAHFGTWGMESHGDVNGDGYEDLFVSSYRYDYNEIAHAYLFYGSASGLGSSPRTANSADWYASAPTYESWVYPAWAGTGFGSRAGFAGDLNGDGYDDLFVGALLYDGGVSNQGAVFIYYGSETGMGATGTTANADWMAVSGQIEGRLSGQAEGAFLAGGGADFNCDGYDDFVMQATTYDDGQADEGAIWVWYGSASGLGENGTPANADWQAQVDQDNARLGSSISTADFNHDGCSDLLAGAYAYDNPDPAVANGGLALVWWGSPEGLGANGTPVNADLLIYGDQDNIYLGRAVDTADVDGNGLADILLGAYGYDDVTPGDNLGRVFLIYSDWKVFLPSVIR